MQDYFSDVRVDRERLAFLSQRPRAEREFIIHFTPRSGSTWLQDIIVATGCLGKANEVFNPSHIPKIAQKLHAADLETYIDMIRRSMNTKGVFCAEVTGHQVKAVFGDYEAFDRYFHGVPCFWLIREDIVAQAVSLAKMVTTRVSHLRQEDGAIKEKLDNQFSYDGEFIKRWLLHIRAAEIASENWFARQSVMPMRLSYERITALAPHQLVNLITRHVGLPAIPEVDASKVMQKIGGAQNVSFADRFRADYAKFMATVDDERAQMIRRLDPIEVLARNDAG